MTGHIHSIESFGTVDGPGVRFVVFFQGCAMRCLYCHNPDTWAFGIGTKYEPRQILEKMTRNLPFYKTGGITATGGEPLCQIDFLIELFSLAKGKGINTCLDTSGCTFTSEHREKFDALLSVCDLIMLDIKHANEEKHLALTSHSGKNTIEFARYVKSKGVPLRIRYVLVPTVNDDNQALCDLAKLIKELMPLEKIEVLPYHNLGIHKYDALGIDYPLKDVPAASEEQAKEALQRLNSFIN